MEYREGIPVLGDWKIIKLIGEGANGKVFEIRKAEYGVIACAALKVIRVPQSDAAVRAALNEGMDDVSVTGYFQDIVDEILKEISVMSSLKGNAHVVSCEDYKVEAHAGDFGWDILIRMELLTSLQDYQRNRVMSEAEVLQLAKDLCSALVYCQKKGLIHRDIKPGNIFVSEDNLFKLGDFGVARTLEKTSGGLSKKGTESYMAPEVYLGRPYGSNVDLYSLGLVLYKSLNENRLPFMPLTGKFRFSDQENAMVLRMKGEPLPRPAGASEAFARVILKACEYDPSKRYRTAAEMLEDLKKINVDEAADTTGSVCEEIGSPEKDAAVGMYAAEEKTIGMAVEIPEEKTIGMADEIPEEKTIGMAVEMPEEETIGMMAEVPEVPEEKTIGMMTEVPEEEKTIRMEPELPVKENTLGMAAESVKETAAAYDTQKSAPKKKKTGMILGVVLGLGVCGAAGYWYAKPYFTPQKVTVYDQTVDMGQEGVWPGTTIGEYKKGEKVTVTAEEKFGWDFVKWSTINKDLDMDDLKAKDVNSLTLEFVMPGEALNLLPEYEAWTGNHTVEYENGTYEGEYVGSVRSGQGTFVFDDGSFYEGEWADNVPNGTGTLVFSETDSKDYYEGEWLNGARSGSGKMYWKNGVWYEGEWADEMPNGIGIMSFSEEDIWDYYEGEWLNGVRSGSGKMYRKDGTYYEGQWNDDVREGAGLFYYGDGAYLEAEWVDDMPDGICTRYYADGTTETLEYVDGELVIKEFNVAVEGGSGSGVYTVGSQVTVKAEDQSSEGKRFAKWILEGVEGVDDVTNETLTFVMPENDVTLTAKYETIGYTVTVEHGGGSGEYKPGNTVRIWADDRSDEGLEFEEWIMKENGVTTAHYSKEALSFTMPENDVTVTACYTEESSEEEPEPAENVTAAAGQLPATEEEIQERWEEIYASFWNALEADMDILDLSSEEATAYLVSRGMVEDIFIETPSDYGSGALGQIWIPDDEDAIEVLDYMYYSSGQQMYKGEDMLELFTELSPLPANIEWGDSMETVFEKLGISDAMLEDLEWTDASGYEWSLLYFTSDISKQIKIRGMGEGLLEIHFFQDGEEWSLDEVWIKRYQD